MQPDVGHVARGLRLELERIQRRLQQEAAAQVVPVSAHRRQAPGILEGLDHGQLQHRRRPIRPGNVGQTLDPGAVGENGDAGRVQRTLRGGFGHDQNPAGPRQPRRQLDLRRQAVDGRQRGLAAHQQLRAAAHQQRRRDAPGQDVMSSGPPHFSRTPSAAGSPRRNRVGFWRRSRTVRLTSPTARSRSWISPCSCGRPLCVNPTTGG